MNLAALKSEDKAYVLKAPSGNSEEARRRVWRIVGIRAGLPPRHDVEVEGCREGRCSFEWPFLKPFVFSAPLALAFRYLAAYKT